MVWFLILACTPDDGGDSAQLPTSGALELLTYNVAGLPDEVSNPERPRLDRMADIAPFLGAYDVVGLQEDFDVDAHALVVAQADHEVQRWFSDTVSAERVYGAGLSLLARGPEISYVEEHYEQCNGVFDGSSDCLASKGFQVVRISLGGAELDLYNTHHEAGGGPDDDAARASQVEQVIASLEGRSAGRAVIFMGDTNLHPDDPDDLPLLDRYGSIGLRDACVEVGCPEGDHIDRFMVRDSDALRLTVEGWRRVVELVDDRGVDLSDHPGIAVTIGWAAE